MPLIAVDEFRFLENASIDRSSPYDDGGRTEILSAHAFDIARQEISAWPGYGETPMHTLAALARAANVRHIFYKDEGGRFGLGSFKALGGAYAVFRHLQEAVNRMLGIQAHASDLISGKFSEVTSGMTVTCATDGNHGKSVAWGAKKFGCRCVIYVHGSVSAARCKAIADFGADVRRVDGNYDDAVRQAADDAERNGWSVISDTSYPGYLSIPRDVMQGYSLMADEAIHQCAPQPTHVFIQGGVGGVAAAVCAHLWQLFGAQRPKLIVVEPDQADCLYQSAEAGSPVAVKGDLDTIMAGLACGEVSLLAWDILRPGADAFMTIKDAAAADVMRRLALPSGDTPIVAGESAVAGLAGFLAVASNPAIRERMSLTADSSILVFGTEGATDPDMYRQIVGKSPDNVRSAA